MSIRKQLKKYYQFRIEAQKVPEMDEMFQKKMDLNKAVRERKSFVLNLVFHTGLIVSLVFVLIVNSNTSQSLQKIDPDNQKGYYLEQRVKKGLDQIKAYFRPNSASLK